METVDITLSMNIVFNCMFLYHLRATRSDSREDRSGWEPFLPECVHCFVLLAAFSGRLADFLMCYREGVAEEMIEVAGQRGR